MSVLESINLAVEQQLLDRNKEVVEYVQTHRYKDTDGFAVNDVVFYEESDDWFDNLIWQRE
jgi:hypothetical protein